MLSLAPLYALVVLLTTFLPVAHSSVPVNRPLKRVANPSTLGIDIIPRAPIPLESSAHRKRLPSPHTNTLRHDDSFRLILSVFDETFFLHLRPNDDLIHPNSRINHYGTGPDGRSVITHSEPLLRETVKVYYGEVVAAHHSYTRMREDAARIIPDTTHPAHLGWARLMVHHQGDANVGTAPEYEGAFSVRGDVYHIMTKHNYLRTKHELDTENIEVEDVGLDSGLVIWRESDMMTPEEEEFATTGVRPQGKVSVGHGCGHDRLDYNNDPMQNPILKKYSPSTSRWYDNPFGLLGNRSLFPRDDVPSSNGMTENFQDFIGSTVGCPTSRKMVLIGVAADCAYVTNFGTTQNATRQILNSFNTASTLYRNTFNVSLGILHLAVQEPDCSNPNPPIPWNVGCGNVTLEDRLSLFSSWRGQQGNDSTGLWHLMSGCPTGTEVGIAWLGTLCRQSAATNDQGETVSGTAVSTSGRLEWQVVAHETGHNFGAIHDCTSDGCTSNPPCCPISATTCDANGQYLMSPVAQTGETNFSPCSIGNICTSMRGIQGAQTDISCLIDQDAHPQLVGLEMCGNGIVEQGEDCDPGQGSNSTCCDSATCKFTNGAQCDPASSSCCTDQCTFAPSTKTCRPSRDPNGACDPAEFCTGNSSACPSDQVAPNGQSCGGNGLACASGQCTSVSLQCQMIGGSMNLSEACPNRSDDSCQVSCKDPIVPNQCRILSALLVDGSPCGFGGTCIGGKCQSAGALDTAKAWYTQNLQIAIPVTIVAGLVALLLLWAIFRAVKRCCCGGRRRTPTTTFIGTVPPAASNMSPHQRLSSFDRSAPGYVSPSFTGGRGSTVLYSPVPQQQPRWGYGPPPQHPTRTNWVDETIYNGSRHS